MSRHRFLAASIVSGVLLSICGGAPVVTSAQAQSARQTTISPLPQRRNVPPRRTTTEQLDPDAASDVPSASDMSAAPDVETSSKDDEALRDGDDVDQANRQANRDGEPQLSEPNQQPQDGSVVQGDAQAVRDGESDAQRDPRLKADIDAFDKPAAGYDALAFQIDQVEPILDRRPARLARFEPYDPVGIRRGTWVLFPELEIGFGATSNIRRSANKEASATFDLRPTIRAVTNWRQHAVELRATGFATAFPGFASENDKAYALEARGRIDFSKRSNIEVLFSHQLDQDSRQARDAIDAALTRADVVTNRAVVAMNQSFNRLSVQLRGSVSDVRYGGVDTAIGFVTNDQRNVTETGAAARASYELKPSLSFFTEVSSNDRSYKVAPADGISRDSRGLRAIAGVSFGNAGQIWRGELALGYGIQRPDDSRLGETSGLIIDANLAWRMSALTSFLLTAKTDFNDSTTVGQSGSRAQTFGLEVRHALRRELIAMAALRNTSTDYRGSPLSERETTAELGLEWFLNQSTALTGRYTHIDFGSSAPGADYTVDTVRFGVRIRQ